MRTTRLLALSLAAAAAAPLCRAADFNGDGYADLAIGERGASVSGFNFAGAVHILFGGPSCLATFAEQTITEASLTGIATPALNEAFGARLETGDFDGDGYDDLAVSAPNERVANLMYAGAVYVIYGSSNVLDVARAQVFHQDTKGIKDKVEPAKPGADWSSESFGGALAAGDFDGDGRDDLAITVNEGLGSKKKPMPYAGAIHVLKGAAGGLTTKGSKLIHQDSKGIPGKAAAEGLFGRRLVAADFDGDGIDDLAAAAPTFENDVTVTILRGRSKKGLGGKGAVVIDETAAGGSPDLINGNYFGEFLAAGDFDGDGAPSLVVGAPFADTQSAVETGAVYVVSLAPETLAITGTQRWSRQNAGIDGGTSATSYFGAALAAGDFNADGRDDLAIGCQQDDAAGEDASGSVTVLPGSSSGLTDADLLVHQNVGSLPQDQEYANEFGAALSAGDFDWDGDFDLAIGIPGKHLAGNAWCGAALIVEGSPSTLLDLTQGHWLDKLSAAISGVPEDNDAFGSAFAP